MTRQKSYSILAFSAIVFILWCNISTMFSGTWVLDESKSEFGNVPSFTVPNKYLIDQTSDSVIITGFSTSENGKEIFFKTSYGLNGGTVIQELSDRRTISAVNIDNSFIVRQSLTNYFDTTRADVKVTDTFKLREDGKVLEIIRNMKYYSKTGSNYRIVAKFNRK